jgi:hypothetical protein
MSATPATDIKFCGVDDPTCERASKRDMTCVFDATAQHKEAAM